MVEGDATSGADEEQRSVAKPVRRAEGDGGERVIYMAAVEAKVAVNAGRSCLNISPRNTHAFLMRYFFPPSGVQHYITDLSALVRWPVARAL